MPGLLAGQERLELLATDCGPPTGWPDPIGGNCTPLEVCCRGRVRVDGVARVALELRPRRVRKPLGVSDDRVHGRQGRGIEHSGAGDRRRQGHRLGD